MDGIDPAEHAASSPSHVQPIRAMRPHEEVVVHGKESGWIEAKIRYLEMWDEIWINNEPHCFGDLFVLERRPPWYINTELCVPGDSGAWVLTTPGDMASWAGMLIAGDGARAFCCFAEYIMNACNNVCPGGLALVDVPTYQPV